MYFLCGGNLPTCYWCINLHQLHRWHLRFRNGINQLVVVLPVLGRDVLGGSSKRLFELRGRYLPISRTRNGLFELCRGAVLGLERFLVHELRDGNLSDCDRIDELHELYRRNLLKRNRSSTCFNLHQLRCGEILGGYGICMFSMRCGNLPVEYWL